MEKLNCESLPERKDFFSELNDEETSIDDCLHAHRVWKEFGLKNMKEYHDLYLTTDILLWQMCLKTSEKCVKRIMSWI